MYAALWTFVGLCFLSWIWPPLGGIGLLVIGIIVVWGLLGEDTADRTRSVT